MADMAEFYDPLLQQAVAENVAETVALAKRALARSYVEVMVSGHYPDEEVLKTARWLAGIDAFTKDVLVRNAGITKADGCGDLDAGRQAPAPLRAPRPGDRGVRPVHPRRSEDRPA